MKIKMKYIVVAVVLASFAAIIYGFTFKEEDGKLANKYIGSGTIGLFLIAMPLFLIKESQGKQMKDYMLTKENIEKMNKREREKKSKK